MQGLGCRVLGLRVQDCGFRVQSSWDLGFIGMSLGFHLVPRVSYRALGGFGSFCLRHTYRKLHGERYTYIYIHMYTRVSLYIYICV